MASSIPLGSLLKHARKTVDELVLSNQSHQVTLDALCGKLSALVCDLSVRIYANSRIRLSCEEVEDLWHIVNKVWVSPVYRPWIVSYRIETVRKVCKAALEL